MSRDIVPEWTEDNTDDPRQVIQRLCALKSEVFQALPNAGAADCFCGTGGFWHKGEWPDPTRHGTEESWYRSDGIVIEFMEKAVREAISNLHGSDLAEPHAATPPHDPANPEQSNNNSVTSATPAANPSKLYQDENGVYLYATKDQYGNIIPVESELEQELHAVAPFDTDEPIFQELLALITQREAKAYDQGYERGRQNRFEENVKAYESGYADGLAELEKGKPDGE